MNVEQQLHTLQEMKAPDTLKSKLEGMVADLPAKHTGFYFPLAAFQAAVVVAVLILLVGLGSGVVAAAKGSHPGSPFYPVKQAIEKVPFLQPTVTPTVAPTRPTSSVTPTVSPTKHTDDKKEKSGGDNDSGSEKKNVKGVSTSVSQNKKTIIPTQSQRQSRVEKFFRSFFHTNKSNSSSRQNNH